MAHRTEDSAPANLRPKEEAGLVCMIEDEEVTRKLVTWMLKSAGFEIRSFHSGEDFFAAKIPGTPFCLLLDVQLPGSDGLQIQRRLESRPWQPPVIFLTSHATVPMSVKGLKAGAFDFLTKPCQRDVLIKTVSQAMVQARRLFREKARRDWIMARVNSLTSREREVLFLLVSGKLNKQIAEELGITDRTVKAHRGSIMEKMGVTSFAEVVWMVGESGLRPFLDSGLER